MKQIVIALIILLIGIGCSHENIPPTSFDATGYPLNLGNWWRYKVTDSIRNTTDTLLLKLTHKMSQNDSIIYRCDLEKRGSIVDSAQIIFSKSALSYTYLGNNYSLFGEFKLKLPFYTGETWKGNGIDAIDVLSFASNYDVLGKKYDVYFIKRSASSFGYYVTQNLQVASGIGIVSQNLLLFDGFNFVKQRFELIDYQLK